MSVLLARQLGVRRISIGDLYRELAARRGLSALQLNRHSELDDTIDAHIDQIQRDIVASGEQLVVDSRLAWHFFAGALKVHLITEPTVAARRVLGRPTEVENYATLEEARTDLESRSESERIRFLAKYGVDKTRLRNYDTICDSTRATPQEILDTIIESLHESELTASSGPACYLDPQRIFPTAAVPAFDESDSAEPIEVGYAARHFFAVRGHQRLGAAIRSGQSLVRASLAEEAISRPADVTADRVHAWDRAFGIELPQLGALSQAG
ncbi:cytidylate kinase [Actinoplanes tereljensis]|uniref:AAA family ATPase n=1 Tax=Paractinoplanes tereljensis TaxID=571912 RepID=UPI0019437A47